MENDNKGIIYIMTSVLPGLIKIGKCKATEFQHRMYNLEHNGYCNITGLRRKFAILVSDYEDKETMLHNIFKKSQVGETEWFALDVDLAIQLLSSFEGEEIFPTETNKQEIFTDTTEKKKIKEKITGEYKIKRFKKSDNKMVFATATIINGEWIIRKGAQLGVIEDTGVSLSVKQLRAQMPLTSDGVLIEDFNLGRCTPSFAGALIIFQACNGLKEWKNKHGASMCDCLKENND